MMMIMEWMDIIRLMEENYDEGKFDLLLTVRCHLTDLLLTIYQGLRHK